MFIIVKIKIKSSTIEHNVLIQANKSTYKSRISYLLDIHGYYFVLCYYKYDLNYGLLYEFQYERNILFTASKKKPPPSLLQ